MHSQTYTPKEVILVKGLSQDHAGAVLAHELMHCWIGKAPKSKLHTNVSH